MHSPRQRFKTMTLVLLVALTGCGKGVFERPAVFPNPAEQVSVRHGSIHASGRDFTVLPDSTVTNIGLTQVIEDSGASAGSAVAGFFTVDSGSGTIMATTSQGCPASTRSQSDLALALDEAARPGSITVSDLAGGQTLAPGVYELTYSVEISSGDLTLDVLVEADAAAMLQSGSLLPVTPGRQVIPGGDFLASDQICRAGSSAALGPSWTHRRNPPVGQCKTPGTSTTLGDRALAGIAAATLKIHALGLQ